MAVNTGTFPVMGVTATTVATPADESTPNSRLQHAEVRVEGLLSKIALGSYPELTEALLYRHLHARGQRIERIEQRIERLAREGL